MSYMKNITEVVATRKLYVEGIEEKDLTVILGKPILLENSDYSCPYQILGDDEKVYYAFGVDSLQALLLAIKIIKVKIELINNKNNNKYKWLGGKIDNFCFSID